jgi:hypothetical protein
MHKGGIMGLVAKLSWFITALAALNIGLAAAGLFDFFSMEFLLSQPGLRMGLQYFVGFMGAFSLFGIVMHTMYCKPGKCDCM